MKRRFVVGTAVMSVEQTRAFADYLGEKGYGWWHWLHGMWLITDESEELEAETLRDKLNEIVPEGRNLVVMVEEKEWAGFGPSTKKSDMFKWIQDEWDKD